MKGQMHHLALATSAKRLLLCPLLAQSGHELALSIRSHNRVQSRLCSAPTLRIDIVTRLIKGGGGNFLATDLF